MKPEKIAVAYKCSVCGLDWAKHSDDSSSLDQCVTLLLGEVTRLRQQKPHYSEFCFSPVWKEPSP